MDPLGGEELRLFVGWPEKVSLKRLLLKEAPEGTMTIWKTSFQAATATETGGSMPRNRKVINLSGWTRGNKGRYQGSVSKL